MIEQIKQRMRQAIPDCDKCSYLLAVSGGVDSMVLLKVFHLLGLDFSVAHFNHQLRGVASERDEALVRLTCKALDISYYTADLDLAEAKNIQLESRQMRYKLLEQWRDENNLDYIVTAHHADDSQESFLINLARGAGINGLSGISLLNSKILRPLIRYDKERIRKFAKKNQVKYREDESNASDQYLRNKLRNHIIPELRRIDHRYASGILSSISNLAAEHKLLNELISRQIKPKQMKDDALIFSKAQLSGFRALANLLHHLFNPHGFTGTQTRNLANSFHKSGLRFESQSHVIELDRESLTLDKRASVESSWTEIRIDGMGTFENELLSFSISQEIVRQSDIAGNDLAIVVREKLAFPLIVTTKNEGDRFQPEGMDGQSKSVKKLFSDLKLTQYQRRNTPILKDANGKIIWVCGYRLDNRFVASEKTQQKCYLKIQPKAYADRLFSSDIR